MRKFNFLLTIFCLAFCSGTGINAQYANFGTGLEGPVCGQLDLTLYNWSDTSVITSPSWDWDIDGDIYTEWEPFLPGLGPGTYLVRLNLYDDGLLFDSMEETVEVYTRFNSFMVSSGGEACPGEELQFWFDEQTTWYSVEWTFGDNTIPEPQDYDNWPSHTFYEEGTYDVTMVLSHYCGMDTITQPIYVGPTAKPNPQGDLSNGPDFCPGDPVAFYVEGEFTDYLWDFGDGNTSSDRNAVHVYATEVPTIYTATITVTNSCGNTNSNTVPVTFKDDLEAYAGFDYDFEGNSMYPCPGTPVEFEAWGTGIYEWDFGDGSISNDQKATNYYTQPGNYYVSLYVRNGCGNEDFMEDYIDIMYDPSDQPFADFYIETETMAGDYQGGDTISVCPGLLVEFTNTSWSDNAADISYEWDFGDGETALSKHASHVYTIAGFDPYEVTLIASNTCGGRDTLTKYILVNAGIMPDVSPGVAPLVICSGEEVFFYLNEGIEDGFYVFDIDFGDGQTLNNATTYADSILQTIANHAYTGAPGQTFDFVFSTTNTCGNTTDFNGSIRITDDDQLTPFYYVDNTTSMEGGGEQMADWSQRKSPDDHEFVIHINWPTWPGGQDNFAVFFWYEGFYPDNDMGPADGYAQFRTSDIMTGDSVKAYIPIDPGYPPMIGFAAGWSCDGTYPQGVEPEVWGMPLDFLGSPMNSLPINPGGYTDMLAISDPIMLDMSGMWDGFCNDEKPPPSSFYQLNAEQYIQLTLDRETNEYYLDATSDEEGYDPILGISYGNYNILNIDTIEFYAWGDCIDIQGLYRYSVTGDRVDFFLISDGCSARVKYLTDSTFIKHPDFGGGTMDFSGCPGDVVQFQIAGGISYEWHFGDASPISTERYPTHVYSAAGEYDAFVIATNACGRSDTVWTPVRISSDNIPYAGFWWDAGELQRLEPIRFEYEEWFDRAGNYSYKWNFGDGNTSTLPDPVHYYQMSGDYTIQLTVTNGCGSSTSTQMIYIQESILNCEAKIHIDSVVDKSVYFKDISRGEITDWFWDFGDGFTSSLQDPVHSYDYDGIFWVCLSVYNSVDDCSHQVCRQVQIGTQLCIADFTSQINIATSKVQFTDRSTNATEWFWDFGDGTFSDLKDAVHTYNEPGWYDVCLSIYNDVSDCFAYKCIDLQVGMEDPDFCYADFSYFVDEETNTVKFTDESSENITNLYWTFGDGTFMEERNPVKTYKGPGIYEICLIVFDDNSGCADEVCMDIPVGVAECNLHADFAFFIDITNDEVAFSNRSGGRATDYFWDFGDGVTSSAMNPGHKYEAPGFYLVILSVWDEKTGCNDHFADFIQIGTVDCRSAFEYKVDAATRNVQFYNQSSGTLSEYFWDFNDGFYSDEKDPLHQYSEPGLYFVSLTVINDNGLCMDFIFEPIQVGTIECAAKFTYFIDSADNVAYFTPEAIGSASDYLWFFGDGAISTMKDARHVFTQAGYFTVGLNTYDEVTGCMDYWEEVILIGSAGEDCRAGFSYMSDAASKGVKFGDRSKGKIVEWIWDFGDGNYSFEQNPQHPYAIGGYYLVCLTVVNNFGIPNTFCDFVQMATNEAEDCFAEFFFTVDSTTKTVEFVQQSHGDPDAYLWNFGDGNTSTDQNPKHTYTDAGYYLIELSISNSRTKCTSNNFDLINVAEGNRGLRALFSYTIDSSNLKADTYPVDFVGVSLGDAGKLKWDFGDGTIDTTTMNPTHVYAKPGKYTACLTISNPITGDENTKCEEVTTPGFVSGTDPKGAWDNMLSNYPNPFDQTTYIVYELREGTSVDLVLFDQTGRMIDVLVKEDQIAGHYRMEYDGSKLDSGIYTLRLATDKGIYTARMVVR